MVSIFARWSPSNCIHCNAEMFVPEELFHDMMANTCEGCFRANGGTDRVAPDHSTHLKCECGADAARVQYHARYCAKYQDPMAPKLVRKGSYND